MGYQNVGFYSGWVGVNSIQWPSAPENRSEMIRVAYYIFTLKMAATTAAVSTKLFAHKAGNKAGIQAFH